MMLIMWDIDHTLLDTGGVGREIYSTAFEHATGTPLLHYPAPNGQLEPALFTHTLDAHGVTDDDHGLWHRFSTEQARLYHARRADLVRRGRVLPGAEDLLGQLEARGARQTVVTGNTRMAAEAKLDAFDLTARLDLENGAYGDEADQRYELVLRVRTRIDHDYAVLIGDTVHDIYAGNAASTYTIGVATGRATPAELSDAGATVALPNLQDSDYLTVLLDQLSNRRRPGREAKGPKGSSVDRDLRGR